MDSTLKIIIQLSAMLEMLIVNLLAVNSCLKNKYSRTCTVLVFTIFTVIFFSGAFLARTSLNIFPPQNGVSIIFGIVYIIPIYFLYAEPLIFKLSAMLTTWIYTMSAYIFSIRIALMFKSDIYGIILLAAQTLFYLLTIKFFLKFIKEKMIYILKHVKSGTVKGLLLLSALWFCFCMLISYSFATPYSHIADIFLVCIFLASALLTYRLLYSSILHQNSADFFKENLNIDYLTKLRNRNALNDDIDNLIKNTSPFSLFFMDIDNLKAINDTYGHLTGDKYLQAFADSIKSTFGKNAEFYRISGDEFVCIYTGNNADEIFLKLSEAKFNVFNCAAPFEGVSVGRADYPKDGSEKSRLLSVADEAMYKHQQLRKTDM